ncbi:hypothetical protein DFH06DRAFT_56330 [Mycena polygramma]|nr:hypothetical protein DFH06DRAFT_56330 [Mycena polygramma]
MQSMLFANLLCLDLRQTGARISNFEDCDPVAVRRPAATCDHPSLCAADRRAGARWRTILSVRAAPILAGHCGRIRSSMAQERFYMYVWRN